MSYEDFLDALPDSDGSEAAEDVLGYCLMQADILNGVKLNRYIW